MVGVGLGVGASVGVVVVVVVGVTVCVGETVAVGVGVDGAVALGEGAGVWVGVGRGVGLGGPRSTTTTARVGDGAGAAVTAAEVAALTAGAVGFPVAASGGDWPSLRGDSASAAHVAIPNSATSSPTSPKKTTGDGPPPLLRPVRGRGRRATGVSAARGGRRGDRLERRRWRRGRRQGEDRRSERRRRTQPYGRGWRCGRSGGRLVGLGRRARDRGRAAGGTQPTGGRGDRCASAWRCPGAGRPGCARRAVGRGAALKG